MKKDQKLKETKTKFRHIYSTRRIPEMGYAEKVEQTIIYDGETLHPSVVGVILDNCYCTERWLVVVFGFSNKKPYQSRSFRLLAKARSWARKTAKNRGR